MVSMNSYDHVVCGEGDCEAFLAMFMVTVIVLNMIVVTAAAIRKLPTYYQHHLRSIASTQAAEACCDSKPSFRTPNPNRRPFARYSPGAGSPVNFQGGGPKGRLPGEALPSTGTVLFSLLLTTTMRLPLPPLLPLITTTAVSAGFCNVSIRKFPCRQLFCISGGWGGGDDPTVLLLLLILLFGFIGFRALNPKTPSPIP